MKQLFYFLVLSLIVISCSDDSSVSTNGDVGGDGTGGSLARFVLVNDYLYTVDNNALKVFDVSNIVNPVLVNDVHVGFDIETIFSYEDHLYIGSQLGMFIYDISDPVFPLRLSEVNHLRSCDPVVSNGDYSYVTLHSNDTCFGNLNRLEVYNTSNPLNPILIATVDMQRPIGLALKGDTLYVTDQDVLRIFDVSDPSQPDLIGGVAKDAFDLIIIDQMMYLIGPDELTQYDIDPNDPTELVELSNLQF